MICGFRDDSCIGRMRHSSGGQPEEVATPDETTYRRPEMTMPTLAGTENVLRSSRSQLVRYASLAAVAGPVSFFAAWFALGVLQPVVRGEYGWIGGFSGAV